jgi:hypothetical protein
MKKPSVSDLVYSKQYPRPRANDPVSFVQHIQRCLVPEVREEVQRYFGRIDCIEAQYPGLDYTSAPHRRRLATFPWHRRLFRLFDELRLTSDEILNLCNWEGTRAAKDRFERESGTEIEITTLHDVASAPEGRGPRAIVHRIINRPPSRPLSDVTNHAAGKRKADVDNEHSDEDETEESIGVHLNQQLIAAADARERGEAATFNHQWEQWMKEALERNEMDLDTILETIRQGRPFPPTSDEEQSSTPQLHPLSILELAAQADADTPTRSNSPVIDQPAEPYDQLHEMLDELTASNARIAADNARLTAQSAEIVHSPRNSADRSRLTNLVEELQSNATRLEAENAAMQNYLSRTRTETAR